MDTEADWVAVCRIRTEVFIEEQNCPPEEEWDAFDATSTHFIGWVGDTPVATARWRPVEFEGTRAAKLERFAVLKPYRGAGYGRALVAHLIADATAAGVDLLVLHAQAYLEAFYSSFGFEPVGERFDEVGIPHRVMVRRTR